MSPGILATMLVAIMAALLLRQWFRLHALGGATLDELDRMSGTDFEEWVGARLHGAGWTVDRQPRSGDFGADLIIERKGLRLAVQVKRRAGTVGNRAVQEAVAGAEFHDCRAVVVITQSRFTDAAREQARRALLPVVLIERDGLQEIPERIAASVRSGR